MFEDNLIKELIKNHERVKFKRNDGHSNFYDDVKVVDKRNYGQVGEFNEEAERKRIREFLNAPSQWDEDAPPKPPKLEPEEEEDESLCNYDPKNFKVVDTRNYGVVGEFDEEAERKRIREFLKNPNQDDWDD